MILLELDYAKVGDVEILVPRLFGEESARSKRASRARTRWNETDLFERLTADATPEEVEAVRRLYEWARPRVRYF